jgi:hypothetical protein
MTGSITNNYIPRTTYSSKIISNQLEYIKEITAVGIILSSILVVTMTVIAIVQKESPLVLFVMVLIMAMIALIIIEMRKHFPNISLILLILIAVVFIAPLGLLVVFPKKSDTLLTLLWIFLLTFSIQAYLENRNKLRLFNQLMNSGNEIRLPIYLPIRNYRLRVEFKNIKSSSFINVLICYFSIRDKQKCHVTISARFNIENASATTNVKVSNSTKASHGINFVFLNKHEIKKPNIVDGSGIDTEAYYSIFGVDYKIWSYGIKKEEIEKTIFSISSFLIP